MRSSMLMVLSAAAFVIVAPQFAFAEPTVAGAALKAAAETISPVETAHYYGGYGYGGYGYGYRHHYYRHHYRHHYRGYGGYGYRGYGY